MPEKVVIGSAELWHGDCREVLPLVAFDVLLCDPPYGIDGGNGGDARDFNKGGYALTGWQDTEEYIRWCVVPVLTLAIARAKRAAITPGVRSMSFYPRPADVGCYWTPAAATHGPWGFTTFQPILYYGKDYRAGRGALPSGRALTEAAEKNGHPCPKPLNAWQWLLDKVSERDDVVFDPFMGSGTGAVASYQTGRRFVGVEMERAYFDIACERLHRAMAQGQLLLPEPTAVAVQQSLELP